MREIKFRVWNIDEKRWANTHEALDIGISRGCLVVKGQHNLIIEQYTGLKDKNGKEIYEGDIVHDIDGIGSEYYTNMAVITYTSKDVGSCGCCIDQFDGIGFVASRKDGFRLWGYDMWEVVGNIHENPELLK